MKNYKLHTHPQMEKELGVPGNHCIVDRIAFDNNKDKVVANIIADIYEMRASVMPPPFKRGETREVENIFKYSFIETMAAVLRNKYEVEPHDIQEAIRERSGVSPSTSKSTSSSVHDYLSPLPKFEIKI